VNLVDGGLEAESKRGSGRKLRSAPPIVETVTIVFNIGDYLPTLWLMVRTIVVLCHKAMPQGLTFEPDTLKSALHHVRAPQTM